jgi:hypothetical protein
VIAGLLAGILTSLVLISIILYVHVVHHWDDGSGVAGNPRREARLTHPDDYTEEMR